MNQKALIDGLRKLSADVSSIADALETSAAAPPEPAPAEAAPAASKKPEPEKAYSYEEVRGILANISHAGHRAEVKALVQSHGGASISSYKDHPDVLAQLVKEAEGLANGT